MAKAVKWIVIVGGIIAVVGQFWGAGATNYYFPLIGGALAIIGGLMS